MPYRILKEQEEHNSSSKLKTDKMPTNYFLGHLRFNDSMIRRTNDQKACLQKMETNKNAVFSIAIRPCRRPRPRPMDWTDQEGRTNWKIKKSKNAVFSTALRPCRRPRLRPIDWRDQAEGQYRKKWGKQIGKKIKNLPTVVWAAFIGKIVYYSTKAYAEEAIKENLKIF